MKTKTNPGEVETLSTTTQTLVENLGVQHGMVACLRRMSDGRALVTGTIDAKAIPEGCNDVVGVMSLEIASLRDATEELRGLSWITIIQEGVKLEHT